MPLEAGQDIINGRYHILRQIGEGGQARVWLAEDTLRALQVAIKEPRADLTGSQMADVAERFHKELRYSGALFQREVPNTVRVITVEEADGLALQVMEYCGGGSLKDRLAGGPLSIADAVRITLDLLAALAVVHEQLGWVHRDIKPENILFTTDGKTRLADFGLAQTGESARSLAGATGHPGSLPYMSPEQAQKTGYLSPASDLYALGCALFEMLTGKLYKRMKPGTTASSLRSDVPPWLDEVVAKALVDDQWGRYASAAQMRAALLAGSGDAAGTGDKRIRDTQPRATQTPFPVRPPSPPPTVRQAPLIAVVLVLLLFALAVVWIVQVQQQGHAHATATAVAATGTAVAEERSTATARTEATIAARARLTADAQSVAVALPSAATAPAETTPMVRAEATSAVRAQLTGDAQAAATTQAATVARSAAATATAAANATATARAAARAPTAAPQPSIGAISVCLPNQVNNTTRSCTTTSSSLKGSISTIWISWLHYNIPLGLQFSRVWYKDGQEFLRRDSVYDGKSFRTTGSSEYTWINAVSLNQTYFPTGNYSVEFYIGGSLAQDASFTIQR